MNAISRALKKGDNTTTQTAKMAPQSSAASAAPTSPKRKRGAAAVDGADPTPVAKQHLSVREGGDIDLGMLDQEAFARVIASNQQQQEQQQQQQQLQQQSASPMVEQQRSAEDEEEEEGPEIVDDVTYQPSSIEVPEGADPVWSLRMTCLPALDLFSTELLKILSSHAHSTILQIVTGSPASPLSHNYMALLHLFDATKKQLYSEEPYQAFLDPDILGFKDMQERKVIRKANLATFISSVFGSVDVGFFHLNEGFLTTMAPDGGRLLKDMARLFLDLKTQAYISAMGQPSRDQNSILNDLFPTAQQLTHLFVQRRSLTGTLPTTPTQDDLTPAEIEFITKCERRKELLRSLGDGEKQVQELKDTYSWETFLRELRGYVAKTWEIIVGSRGGKPRRPMKKRTSAGGVTAGFEDGAAANSGAGGAIGFIPSVAQTSPALGAVPSTAATTTSSQPIWEAYEKARMTHVPTGPAGSAMGSSGTGIPPPQTPAGKSTVGGHTPRTASDGSQIRRPWTKDEEAALFAGLEAVQGPNWAAILQLYGPGGSVSEALKDRSQVQLKDKARNLKLFFLKGGHEVPRVLEKVTGRLKGENTPDDTPTRRTKKRRVGESANTEQHTMPTSQQTQEFQERWEPTQSQGQNFPIGNVGQNVDPGLQMPEST